MDFRPGTHVVQDGELVYVYEPGRDEPLVYRRVNADLVLSPPAPPVADQQPPAGGES